MAVLGLQPSGINARRDKSRNKRKKERRNRVRSAVSTAQVDAVLGPLAEMMWHGEDDDALSVNKLESLIAGGQRVIVQCTNQAKLAERALNQAGITARMVNPFYAGPWDSSWGHTSMEVLVEGRWQVFDPTGNAQLVDQEGRGMDVSTACTTRPILTRPFASDPLWAWEGAPADLEAYYERVFQIPVIHHAHLWLFHDAANRSRIESMGRSWQMASAKEWEKLIR
jgi:hypothetical protein